MINFTIKSDDETIEKSSTEPFGDLELIELEYINEHQLFVSIDGGAQFKIADEKLLFGGNYQFVYIQDGPDYTVHILERNKRDLPIIYLYFSLRPKTIRQKFMKLPRRMSTIFSGFCHNISSLRLERSCFQ
jgi:hypothetical protein